MGSCFILVSVILIIPAIVLYLFRRNSMCMKKPLIYYFIFLTIELILVNIIIQVFDFIIEPHFPIVFAQTLTTVFLYFGFYFPILLVIYVMCVIITFIYRIAKRHKGEKE